MTNCSGSNENPDWLPADRSPPRRELPGMKRCVGCYNLKERMCYRRKELTSPLVRQRARQGAFVNPQERDPQTLARVYERCQHIRFA